MAPLYDVGVGGILARHNGVMSTPAPGRQGRLIHPLATVAPQGAVAAGGRVGGRLVALRTPPERPPPDRGPSRGKARCTSHSPRAAPSGPGPCRERLVALHTSPLAAPPPRDRCHPHPIAPYSTEPSGDSWLPLPPGRCSSVCAHYPAPGAPMAVRRGLSRQLGPPFVAPTAGEAPLRALLPLAVGDSLTP